MRSGDGWPQGERVLLEPLTTLRVGGAARWFVRVTTAEEIAAAVRWCDEHGMPLLVLGGGSNLVVADAGFDGLVLHMGMCGTTVNSAAGDVLVTAGAGEPWDDLVSAVTDRGLAGLECLSGIPGTVGGTPIQNVGAYGQDVAQSIERVTVYDRTQSQTRTLTAAECGFAYRTSRFRGSDAGRFVVCDVTFRLRPGPPSITYPDVVTFLEQARIETPTVRDTRDAVLAIRRRKAMVIDPADPDTRSVGSFFMNPIVSTAVRERISGAVGEVVPGFAVGEQVKVPAAWLIERAGFHRGDRDGAVGISTKHSLAIVNLGQATAADVVRLATRIKRSVAERFGVWLRPEPVFVGFADDQNVAFLQKPDGDD